VERPGGKLLPFSPVGTRLSLALAALGVCGKEYSNDTICVSADVRTEDIPFQLLKLEA
jgi:hypothetical protein